MPGFCPAAAPTRHPRRRQAAGRRKRSGSVDPPAGIRRARSAHRNTPLVTPAPRRPRGGRGLRGYLSLISRKRCSRKPWAVIGSGYRLGLSAETHEGSTSIRKSGLGCRKNGTE